MRNTYDVVRKPQEGYFLHLVVDEWIILKRVTDKGA